ncbi:MAG: peptidoglycan DD-metalloendopeptidase family protein [Bacilli bacterium]|nr:peptidoglycan DD-metalloendopeptidase family protein [Bacilli bacterium]
MNKGLKVFLLILCIFSFGFRKNASPSTFYRVYLDEKLLGTVKSKTELENYIDKQGSYYKKKFGVKKVYSPTELKIIKVTTYNSKVDSVSSVYRKINENSKFTVKGYEFKIKNVDSEGKVNSKKVYVLKKKVFSDAVVALIDIFVGEDKYKAYIEDNQMRIESTGQVVQNVYIDESITVKEVNIPVDEFIYMNSTDLAQFLLYGRDRSESIYEVRAGDTIESLAFLNKISPEEVLISNSDLTSKNNLLFPGQKITISQTNPQISVVEESYVVQDIESQFKTDEKYDDNTVIGQDRVEQEGVNGLDRVSQKVKKVNGNIVYVDLQDKTVLKDPVNRVIVKGNKYVPDVGSLTNWGWPTDSGWTLSSNYGYRSMWGGRELHTGLDIAGTGYGSRIYATNNGRVIIAESHYSYGNYVVIDHNNGYMTVYAHMSRIAARVGQVVARGDVIGYVGCTGSCTGPHVHYEIWKGSKYNHINPAVLYPGGYR